MARQEMSEAPASCPGWLRRLPGRAVADPPRPRSKETHPMVRSYWKGALVLTLAVGGVIRAQQTAVPPLVATAPNGIVTVQQMGKPAQKCRILESWPTGDGKTAVKVQSLETGEVSTIIEGPSAGLMKTPGKAP